MQATEILVRLSLSNLEIDYKSWEDMERVNILCDLIRDRLRSLYPQATIEVRTCNDSGLNDTISTVSITEEFNAINPWKVLESIKKIESVLNPKRK